MSFSSSTTPNKGLRKTEEDSGLFSVNQRSARSLPWHAPLSGSGSRSKHRQTPLVPWNGRPPCVSGRALCSGLRRLRQPPSPPRTRFKFNVHPALGSSSSSARHSLS